MTLSQIYLLSILRGTKLYKLHKKEKVIFDSKISPKLEKIFALFIFDIYFMRTLFRRTQSVYYLARGSA